MTWSLVPLPAVWAAGLAAFAGWFGSAGAAPAIQRLRPANDRRDWRVLVRRFAAAAGRPAARRASLATKVAVGLFGLFAISTAAIPLAVALGAGLFLLRRAKAARKAQEALRQQAEDLPVLRALAAELRGGLPPAAALRAAAGPGASPARGMRRRMLAAAAADGLGGDAAAVLANDAEPWSAATAVAAAWAVCRQSGASLAAPVRRIADSAATSLRAARETDAALASARSTARLLAVLPLAGVALGTLSGSGSARVLLTTQLGQGCLLVGVGLDLAGVAWLDRLARAASE